MLELNVFYLLEIFNGKRIGTGPTTFDEIDPQSIKFLGNADLVINGKVEVLGLGAVPQGCIVYLYGHICLVVCS